MQTEAPVQHQLSVMSPKHGDFKVVWDPNNNAEVAAAQASFDKLRREGMCGYSVEKSGEKGKVVTTFDPKLQAIIMAPPIVGG